MIHDYSHHPFRAYSHLGKTYCPKCWIEEDIHKDDFEAVNCHYNIQYLNDTTCNCCRKEIHNAR